MRFLRALGAAFSYFSILPIRNADEGYTDGAVALLPLVGLVIGVLSALGVVVAWGVTGSFGIAVLAAWALPIGLSGAIHIDGFLDSCDGLFAMAPPEKRLEIMRDPHHGTYAIVGMAILSAFWLYALSEFSATILPLVIAFTAVASRWAAICSKFRLAALPGIAIAAALGLLLAKAGYPRMGLSVFICVLAAFLVALLVELFARSRLGGKLTGDCYGAAIVVTEVVLLLLLYPALKPLMPLG